MIKDTPTRSTHSENYYFQISPIKLHLTGQAPSQSSSFRTVIYKGLKLFDQSREYVKANFNTEGYFQFDAVFLNFLVLAYQPSKNISYTFKLLSSDGNRQEQVGNIEIDTGSYVKEYKANNKQCLFKESSQINDKYSLDYEIYMEKSRFNLQQFVKQMRGLNLKSPKDRDTRSQSGSRRLSSNNNQDTQSEIRQVQQQNTPVKRNITPIMSRNQPPSESISRGTPQKPRYVRQNQNQSQQRRSLKLKGAANIKPQQPENQKPTNVRQRVAQLHKQSEQQYSLHAPKNKEMHKSYKTQPLKSSRLKRQAQAQKARQQQKLLAVQPSINWKGIAFKIALLIVSFFCIYLAMTPGKKWYSKKRVK